jgi:phage gpG-like protein
MAYANRTAVLDMGQLGDLLGAAMVRAGDLTPVLNVAAKRHHARVLKHFESESSAPAGNAWPDLSPKYKARRKWSGSMLHGTGALLNSIQHYVMDGNTIVLQSDIVYSRAHDLGYPDGNLPMRKFLAYQDDDVYVTIGDAFVYVLTGGVPNA